VLATTPPAQTDSEAEGIARAIYGIEGTASRLYGERDSNFLLRAVDGSRSVLKIANRAERPEVIDFQLRILEHLERVAPELPVPKLIPTLEGALSHALPGGEVVRAITFLPGRSLRSRPYTPTLLDDVGATLARLARALRGFFHPAAGHVLQWDIRRAPSLRGHVAHIGSVPRQALVRARLDHLEADVIPKLASLRAQVLHADGTPDNLLLDESGDRVAGVIDFGDSLHTALACDLAVSMAAVSIWDPQPLEAATRIAAGYHRRLPLEAEEVEVLPDLMIARLVTSVTISAWRSHLYPDMREDLTQYEEPGFRLLESLRDDRLARFRAALHRRCA
jgi:Ser/Thr protein kinase RdoA (MazF antagonist)